MTTLRGYFHLSRVLTFNDTRPGQGSLHGRCLGLHLRGGSRLLSGRHDFLSRHRCAGSSPSQDRSVDFLQCIQAGRQPSTTTTSNVLLGKVQHLQARPDHRHGWGPENTSDVDQSCLGRRFFLRLGSRCLFSSSSGGFCAPLSNRGLALHLRQRFLHGGGWATTTPSPRPHGVPIGSDALINGVGRWHLLQSRVLHCQHTRSRYEYSTTLVKTSYLLGCGLSDLQLLGHTFAGHIARLPWRRGQTSL
jgi:hypothetical protein